VTIRPRVVRALRDARTRLRDVAAAAHATASAERDARARALEDHRATLETALDHAAGALAGARSVYEIDLVAEGTGVHRFAVADATERHTEATAVTATTAEQLRGRTRQLRTAERLVDLVDEHRAKHEARAEQRSADDMAARRR
jgi:hypothetical protein